MVPLQEPGLKLAPVISLGCSSPRHKLQIRIKRILSQAAMAAEAHALRSVLVVLTAVGTCTQEPEPHPGIAAAH